LWTAGIDHSPRQCAEQAAAAIDNCAAEGLLARWAALTKD
jgi:hypothetical protein